MPLIHMNGRIYDATLGRFIQADPLIDAGIQGLNRYSYVLNNPLSYTDPTGHLTWGEWMRIGIGIAVTAATAGAAGGTLNGVYLSAGQKAFVIGAGGAMVGAASSNSLKGAAWGAVSALAFYGIGSYFEGASWASDGKHVFGTNLDFGGYSMKVLAHGVAGGTLQHLQGGRFGSGFAAAGITQAFSGGIDTIDPANPSAGIALRVGASALLGGVVSDLTGGKFAHGAVTAAFSRAFNDEATRSWAQRMRGQFTNDGSGVDLNLFDAANDQALYQAAEDFPDHEGVFFLAAHAVPTQPLIADQRTGVVDYVGGERAAQMIVDSSRYRPGDQIVVIGCGAGTSGFTNALFRALEGRGISAPVTGPTTVTGFARVRWPTLNRSAAYFPEMRLDVATGKYTESANRAYWSTVGGQR